MSFKTSILTLGLLLPSLFSFSQRLQVNVFWDSPTAFPQDTVTQKVILEFIEEAQLSSNDTLEILGRGPISPKPL